MVGTETTIGINTYNQPDKQELKASLIPHIFNCSEGKLRIADMTEYSLSLIIPNFPNKLTIIIPMIPKI